MEPYNSFRRTVFLIIGALLAVTSLPCSIGFCYGWHINIHDFFAHMSKGQYRYFIMLAIAYLVIDVIYGIELGIAISRSKFWTK